MKSLVNFVMVTILLVTFAGVISAVTGHGSTGNTKITGIIYNSDYTAVISGANVSIGCNGYVNVTTSSATGKYSVNYDQSLCSAGDSLYVMAQKGSLIGSAYGTIYTKDTNLDLAVVNIPLVPEFGFFIGILTILSAIGVFFVVRKE